MTTSANPADGILFLRNIHPKHFRSQTLQHRDFKGKKDDERLTPDGNVDEDYLATSVDISTPFYNAQQSYERYRRSGLSSTGVVGLTMREIMSLGLTLEHKPTKVNPHHWHIVFPKCKNGRSTSGKLLEFASQRGWLYAPYGTEAITSPAKPAP